VRLALILFWLVAAVLVARLLLRRLALPPRRARPARELDELVKDPVCQTYVVRSRAVTRTAGGEVTYFCSDECARRADRA
jgi:YHS domain-containing protein